MSEYREVFGTLLSIENGKPLQGVEVLIELEKPSYMAAAMFPKTSPLKVATDKDGIFRAILWANTEGAVQTRYKATILTQQREHFYFSVEPGATPLSLSDYRALNTDPEEPLNPTAYELLTTHEAEIASTSDLGHVMVDGSTISINSSGVLSVIAGGTAVGAEWHHTTGEPPNTLGKNGDYALEEDGDVWKKLNGAWEPTGVNLAGTPGPEGPAGASGTTLLSYDWDTSFTGPRHTVLPAGTWEHVGTRGTGSVTVARSSDGISFANVTPPFTTNNGDVIRLSPANVGAYLAYTLKLQ